MNENDPILLDKTELEEARWFDVQFLLEAYNTIDFAKLKQSKSPHSDFLEYKDIRLSYVVLLWLKNYFNKTCMYSLIQNSNVEIF